MVCASRLAQGRGLVVPEVTVRQVRLLEAFGLPTAPKGWNPEELLAAMRLDKKALAGKLRLVLPTRLGHARLFEDVTENEVRGVLSPASSSLPLGGG
jgi:3-dehydroquinate synthase